MTAALVAQHLRLVAGDQQPESDQESVQQGGVVRVFQILMIKLPVARQRVAVIAQHDQLAAVEGGVEFARHLRAEIGVERLHVVGIGGEDHAAARGDAEMARMVIGRIEIRRHAALAIDAAAERDARQVAFQVVGPLMVRADEFLHIAAQLAAELGGTVRAAILEDIDAAILVARHHHRDRADEGTREIARIGDFRFQPDIVPGAALEDLLDLQAVNMIVGIDPVGHAAQTFGRPDIVLCRI